MITMARMYERHELRSRVTFGFRFIRKHSTGSGPKRTPTPAPGPGHRGRTCAGIPQFIGSWIHGKMHGVSFHPRSHPVTHVASLTD